MKSNSAQHLIQEKLGQKASKGSNRMLFSLCRVLDPEQKFCPRIKQSAGCTHQLATPQKLHVGMWETFGGHVYRKRRAFFGRWSKISGGLGDSRGKLLGIKTKRCNGVQVVP